LIKVDNLSKNYDDVKAVKSISFELQDGQVVGFLGANGAGKSTTLKIMTGYISPSSGNVYYGNRNIQDDTSDIQKDIGYLPELNPLYSEMRVQI
jgi:ABC-2 type transport system ATP-binding protein